MNINSITLLVLDKQKTKKINIEQMSDFDNLILLKSVGCFRSSPPYRAEWIQSYKTRDNVLCAYK